MLKEGNFAICKQNYHNFQKDQKYFIWSMSTIGPPGTVTVMISLLYPAGETIYNPLDEKSSTGHFNFFIGENGNFYEYFYNEQELLKMERLEKLKEINL